MTDIENLIIEAADRRDLTYAKNFNGRAYALMDVDWIGYFDTLDEVLEFLDISLEKEAEDILEKEVKTMNKKQEILIISNNVISRTEVIESIKKDIDNIHINFEGQQALEKYEEDIKLIVQCALLDQIKKIEAMSPTTLIDASIDSEQLQEKQQQAEDISEER